MNRDEEGFLVQTPDWIKRLKIDSTINIPTLLTFVALVAGPIIWAVGTYQDQQLINAGTQNEIARLNGRVDGLEKAVAMLGDTNARAIGDTRNDIKADISELRMDIKNLMQRSYQK